jgi:Fe-S oxidoreductase
MTNAGIIYFKGCVARKKLEDISNATEEILKKAGVDYQVIIDEPCCGSILLRTGFVEDALEQMKITAQLLNGKTILVSCAGCYRTLKKDYKELLNVNMNIIHTSQLFYDLIKQKKINIEPSQLKVTYHDPCHLGRHCEEYESPRKVIEYACTFIEMEHNRENSLCCGSGGGVKSAFPEIANNIALERLKEAEKTGADIITTSCPFCKLNLMENGPLKVLDLSELIVRCIENE